MGQWIKLNTYPPEEDEVKAEIPAPSFAAYVKWIDWKFNKYGR